MVWKQVGGTVPNAKSGAQGKYFWKSLGSWNMCKKQLGVQWEVETEQTGISEVLKGVVLPSRSQLKKWAYFGLSQWRGEGWHWYLLGENEKCWMPCSMEKCHIIATKVPQHIWTFIVFIWKNCIDGKCCS